MSSILIVDDLVSIHEMLEAVVQPLGHTVETALNGEEALQKYKAGKFDIVLTDIKMEPMDGTELLQQLKDYDPSVIVIMMSGYADMENAMESLHHGAFDFLTKPFKVDLLMASINRAAAKAQASEQAGSEDDEIILPCLAGSSPAAKKLRKQVAKLEKSTKAVLISGEKGAPIERVARSLSNDEATGFNNVSCKDLSKDELEKCIGELAEEKGSAILFTEAENLDEDAQVSLRECVKDSDRKARLIIGSCEALESLVEKGAFDEALFYALSNARIHLPSIREQGDDLPEIIEAILAELDYADATVDAQAMSILQGYSWPGNYQELQEVVEDAVASCEDSIIKLDDLPERLRDMDSWPNLESFIESNSRQYMRRVLEACRGNAAQAAKILSCDETSLKELA